jgi:chromosome segregation ATPase
MKIKHKLLSDYQYTNTDKKIFLIKSGTILEEYNYKLKGESILIDKDVIDANPEIFSTIDWKVELLAFIKANKLPTPAVLTKKLIPFIDEMVLSGMQKNTPTGTIVDESVVKELQRKESDLNSREKRIKEKEDEINIRIKRVEKREGEYKEDLKSLDKKEDNLREKSKEIIEKGLDLDDKIQDLNEKERNLDRTALESSKEIDGKYKKLQEKIDIDLKALSEREKDLEKKVKSLSKKEEDIADIFEKSKLYDLLKEDVKDLELEILHTLNVTNTLNENISEPAHVRIGEHNIKINNLIASMRKLYDKVKKTSL